jgi:hypothetical protein
MYTGYARQVQEEFGIMDAELKECLLSVLDGCLHNTLPLPATRVAGRYVVKARECSTPQSPLLRAMVMVSDHNGRILRVYSSYEAAN